jgi:predicted Zn-dependent protease
VSGGLAEAARRATDAALSAGATDAEAWAEESTSRQVRVYDGDVESLSDAGGRGVGVRAFVGPAAATPMARTSRTVASSR